jgi:hypothetical protein
VLGADNLTTFMCRLSGYLGASSSRNPQGLSRPVMGLLLLLRIYMIADSGHLSVSSFLSWIGDGTCRGKPSGFVIPCKLLLG